MRINPLSRTLLWGASALVLAFIYVPILVVVGYLWAVRKTGALENL